MEVSKWGSARQLDAGVVIASAAVAVAAVAWSFNASAALQPIEKCDVAIMERLRAPWSYGRYIGGSACSGETCVIHYHAENAVGLALNGHGVCTISNDGSARWSEASQANIFKAEF